MSDEYYVIPAGEVAHELMEGEVIVIHFASGCYYSLQGSAALIWSWLGEGASVRQIVASFQNVNPQEEREIGDFLAHMASERIVKKGEQAQAGFQPAAAVPYQKPLLEIYKDMQELMLVDPIHEVGAAGWPKPLAE